VSLFRSREPEEVPAGSPICTAAGFADYYSAETSSIGAVALLYSVNSVGGCSYPVYPYRTEIGASSLAGMTRISPNGKYAINFNPSTARLYNGVTVSYVDLQTNQLTLVNVPATTFPEYVQVPYSGLRSIADDGTAIVGVTDGSRTHHGFLLRPGASPLPFPQGLPLGISAAADRILVQGQDGIFILEVATGLATQLLSSDSAAFGFRMSDDGRRLMYLRAGQVHLLETVTRADRTLASDAVSDATMSGDGMVVHVVTAKGALLRIAVDTGVVSEWVGRTPYLSGTGMTLTPGLIATRSGVGLADSVLDGTAPFRAWLGTLTMWIGERKVPVIHLEPNSVSFLVPWDIQAENGKIRIQAEVKGENTPFYFPEVIAGMAGEPFPRAGLVARLNWEPFYVGPVSPGEIIHVFALGFGPVSPEVPEGALAPAAEPYARLAQNLSCSNLEVLYAGLAPYNVQRIYQLDLRIGPKAGYQQFSCTLGGGTPFVFLTLNVVP
jgi:uncharacterized protein (TIGR03437 family)